MAKGFLLILALALSALAAAGQTTCKRCKFRYDPSVHVYQGRALNRVMAYAATRAGVSLSPAGSRSAAKIVKKESTYSTRARNRRSSSRGLFGLLNSTRASVGVPHNHCPSCQAESGLRYIKGRYGSPQKAYRHSRARGWY